MADDDYADDAFAGDDDDTGAGSQVLPSTNLTDALMMIGDLGKTGSQMKLHATVDKARSPRKPLSQKDKLVKRAYRVLNKAKKKGGVVDMERLVVFDSSGRPRKVKTLIAASGGAANLTASGASIAKGEVQRRFRDEAGELKLLRQLFDWIDADKTGTLSRKELKGAMEGSTGAPWTADQEEEQDMRELMRLIFENNKGSQAWEDGSVSWQEMQSMYRNAVSWKCLQLVVVKEGESRP